MMREAAGEREGGGGGGRERESGGEMGLGLIDIYVCVYKV